MDFEEAEGAAAGEPDGEAASPVGAESPFPPGMVDPNRFLCPWCVSVRDVKHACRNSTKHCLSHIFGKFGLKGRCANELRETSLDSDGSAERSDGDKESEKIAEKGFQSNHIRRAPVLLPRSQNHTAAQTNTACKTIYYIQRGKLVWVKRVLLRIVVAK